MRFARFRPWSAIVFVAPLALFPWGAQADDVCPLYSNFVTDPAVPNDQVPTHVTVYGCSPCAEVVGSSIVGPTEVEVILRYAASCADTVTAWSRSFDLGVLPAGHHNLVITVRDEATPWLGQVFGTWIDVAGDVPPPPPPPPTTEGPLFTFASTLPFPATTSAPTVLVAHGVFPYPCGFVSTTGDVSPSHVTVTLRRGVQCLVDTMRVWEQPILLGLLSAGTYNVQVTVRDANEPDSLAVHEYSTSFEVKDDGPPPPPPPPLPPVDSLETAQPNPFSHRTRFALTTPLAAPVDVRIYDARGQLVRKIFSGEIAAGTREFLWDGTRDDGSRARAGVYFYRVVRPGATLSQRVVLLPAR